MSATFEPSPRRRPSGAGALMGAGALGLAAALLAVGISLRLDRPVASAPRDPEPILAGRAQVDGTTDAPPPLSMALARPLPSAVASLPTAAQQVAALRRNAATGDALALVQLGAAEQRIGDPAGAAKSFDRALSREPGRLDALVGQALAQASITGDAAAADRRLARLAAANPRSQVVTFNRGLLAAYSGDAALATREWRRTVALGARTALGRTAGSLLAEIAKGRAAPSP